ncbi:TetR/AcrR family transcriptional regulator [Streptomyces sp. TRM66268-LWL]|uniref:TetR/AcrR family transcriptional regulator n=1 Tax=Streptomyces polyasparticus TaxID=2767826 RepID=A0ABR7SVB5_9ACTN|nr:TetR/AcrR family transcriptional regulator [Streptomyces polyasparticus]MBC9718208.1 TetR/AcrR family transcriptional regulator [Streptomyces polyasparticus]
MTSTTPRERYRTQVKAEIKAKAWEQIAVSGAPGLSLNAIAKQLGMTGPALYRYFSSRDELLTELIRDAYGSFSAAVAAAGEVDLAGLARVVREWALADPQRYFLTYGTPVPGYQAPEDTRATAQQVMDRLVAACAGLGPDPEMRAVRAWTRLHGVLSLELAGHFSGMDLDPSELFEAEVRSLS